MGVNGSHYKRRYPKKLGQCVFVTVSSPDQQQRYQTALDCRHLQTVTDTPTEIKAGSIQFPTSHLPMSSLGVTALLYRNIALYGVAMGVTSRVSLSKEQSANCSSTMSRR